MTRPTWRHAIEFDRPGQSGDWYAAEILLRNWGTARGLTPITGVIKREDDFGSLEAWAMEFVGEKSSEPYAPTYLVGEGRKWPEVLAGSEEAVKRQVGDASTWVRGYD